MKRNENGTNKLEKLKKKEIGPINQKGGSMEEQRFGRRATGRSIMSVDLCIGICRLTVVQYGEWCAQFEQCYCM